MRLLIVIVNYCTGELVADCLAALAPQVAAIPGSKVVIADNASGDASVATIDAAIRTNGWGAWATLEALRSNGGFAWGNNRVIQPALGGAEPPEYVLLLNPDTVPRPGALAELLDFMDHNPSVGIAGSRLEWEDGTQHDSRYRFHSLWSELDAGLRLGFVTRLLRRHLTPPLVTHAHPIDWVAGASMIVRKAVFDAIGTFDEGYFLYYEESDFCLRARRAGWPCWYVPSSRVAHLVGKSSGVTNQFDSPKRRPRYWFQSRRRYFVKNHGMLYLFATNVAFASGYALWRLRRFLQRKPDHDPPHFLRDFLRFSFLGSRSSRPAPHPGTPAGAC